MRMLHHVSAHSINSQRLGSGLTASRVICANVHCGRLRVSVVASLSLGQQEVEYGLYMCWALASKTLVAGVMYAAGRIAAQQVGKNGGCEGYLLALRVWKDPKRIFTKLVVFNVLS